MAVVVALTFCLRQGVWTEDHGVPVRDDRVDLALGFLVFEVVDFSGVCVAKVLLAVRPAADGCRHGNFALQFRGETIAKIGIPR